MTDPDSFDKYINILQTSLFIILLRNSFLFYVNNFYNIQYLSQNIKGEN